MIVTITASESALQIRQIEQQGEVTRVVPLTPASSPR
jgi:hypothetical protein